VGEKGESTRRSIVSSNGSVNRSREFEIIFKDSHFSSRRKRVKRAGTDSPWGGGKNIEKRFSVLVVSWTAWGVGNLSGREGMRTRTTWTHSQRKARKEERKPYVRVVWLGSVADSAAGEEEISRQPRRTAGLGLAKRRGGGSQEKK